jgi:L-lactate dehydrogenase complex protein LldE
VKLPSVSVAMADEKLDEWVAAGVTTVVAGDLSCLLHLEGRAKRRRLPLTFRHLGEVLGG